MSDDKNNAIKEANRRWDKIHNHYERDDIVFDNWLDTFEKQIFKTNKPVIDLGCGSGNNTLYLIEKNKVVIPCDYSNRAILNISNNFPEVKETKCFDMSKGFPFSDNYSDIIIADLSLHYFTEQDTFNILNEIVRVLTPKGLLIFRVNSINDFNHGAGKGKEVEKHLYKTDDGRYKRFFDNDDIKKFLVSSSWKPIYIKEEKMGRYEKEKILWKCAFQLKK